MHGHIAAHPVLVRTLAVPGVKHLFIFRDPRDVVVSQLFWWRKVTRDGFWPYQVFRGLDTDDERLSFLIEGMDVKRSRRSGVPEGISYPDIGSRMAEFLPWLQETNCQFVRFEELVDPEHRSSVIEGIARHVLPENDERKVHACADAMEGGTDPSRSKTFRKGKPGEWRRHFSEAHVDLFKRYAGETLIHLGYEKDLNW